jgi:hypothetical protein
MRRRFTARRSARKAVSMVWNPMPKRIEDRIND